MSLKVFVCSLQFKHTKAKRKHRGSLLGHITVITVGSCLKVVPQHQHIMEWSASPRHSRRWILVFPSESVDWWQWRKCTRTCLFITVPPYGKFLFIEPHPRYQALWERMSFCDLCSPPCNFI